MGVSWYQARIQDFAQGGATAKRCPEITGSEARGLKVPPIKNQKLCGFGPQFFGWVPFTFLFSYFYSLILSYFTPQGGLGPRTPPPPPGYVPDWRKAIILCLFVCWN